MKYAVGIDVGGTNTRVALVDEEYKILKREQFSTNEKNPEETLQKINEVIQNFGCKTEGIGISCPGPLDLIHGIILTPPNLPGWHHYQLTKRLREITGIKVQLENDANLACLAEALVGAGKGKDYVQFLTISTGVGAGFCVGGEIYRGSKGFAQEVANSILWKGGPSQGDLKAGSIESISSGTAIVKRAKDAGLETAHAGQVYEKACAGDAKAQKIMEDTYEYLSSFLGILYGVLDPEIFVLGGSVALKIPGFIEEVERRTKDKVYDALKENVKVVPAVLGEDCGLIGAACLAFQGIE
jgi:glucokinase